jgi:hypothetical protein
VRVTAQLEALLEATERYVPKPRRKAFWRVVVDTFDGTELEEAYGLDGDLDEVIEEVRAA